MKNPITLGTIKSTTGEIVRLYSSLDYVEDENNLPIHESPLLYGHMSG